jgi:hypothetical protein
VGGSKKLSDEVREADRVPVVAPRLVGLGIRRACEKCADGDFGKPDLLPGNPAT